MIKTHSINKEFLFIRRPFSADLFLPLCSSMITVIVLIKSLMTYTLLLIVIKQM